MIDAIEYPTCVRNHDVGDPLVAPDHALFRGVGEFVKGQLGGGAVQIKCRAF